MMLSSLFAVLPTSMQALEKVVHAMDKVDVVAPPDVLSIGERLRKTYAEARKDGYVGLPKSALRKLPFAYWVDRLPELPVTDPELVEKYWNHALVEAVQGNPRRAKRWLAPLFYVYCLAFDRDSPSFIDFSQRLNRVLSVSIGAYASKLNEMNAVVSFFNPAAAPSALAKSVFASNAKSLDQIFQDYLLWPGFVDSNLGQAVLKAGLKLPATYIIELATIGLLFTWVNRQAAPIHKSPLRIEFANAVLEAWYRKRPSEALKKILIEFFIKQNSYGDPRIEGFRQYQWQGVSDKALSTILGWLAGDTLRGFMTLLARTADQIWRHRQKFWMAYYDRGYIDEAWLALGPDALHQVRTLTAETRAIGFGRLEGGAANNQSVLLLRIGDLVFTEWSHNGSLRAYWDERPQTPKLYHSTYSGEELRAARSLDFHDGLNMRPELAHHHSDSGTWQRKARDFIRRHTGVHLADGEIV